MNALTDARPAPPTHLDSAEIHGAQLLQVEAGCFQLDTGDESPAYRREKVFPGLVKLCLKQNLWFVRVNEVLRCLSRHAD